MAEDERERQRDAEDEPPDQVLAEGDQAVLGLGVALRGGHEAVCAAQRDGDQRRRVDRSRQGGDQHARQPGRALVLVRAHVVAAVEEVETHLQGGGVHVQHQPQGGRHHHPARTEREVQDPVERSEHPGHRGRRVVGHQERVVHERPRREPVRHAPEAAHHDLVGPARPAVLLAEVVGEGGRALSHRHHVRGVDRGPALPRRRVLRSVEGEARGHVLGDRVLEAADLPQSVDAHRVVGAHQHRRAAAVARPLQERVEQELLRLGGPHDEVVVVAVDLRTDHEGHVGIAEVAQEALREVGQRHVVGIDPEEEVVELAVPVEPGVVVAVLGPGLVRAGGLVPALHPAPGEMKDAELVAQAPDLVVVALVEEPHVERPVVVDLQRGLERGPHQLERLLAGHDRGQEGHPLAGRGFDGHRIPGQQRRPAQRGHVEEREAADHRGGGGHAERRHVDDHALRVGGPVARQHQPHQEPADEYQRGHDQERGQDRPRVLETPEPHPVGPGRRFGQRAGDAAALVVVVMWLVLRHG